MFESRQYWCVAETRPGDGAEGMTHSMLNFMMARQARRALAKRSDGNELLLKS